MRERERERNEERGGKGRRERRRERIDRCEVKEEKEGSQEITKRGTFCHVPSHLNT